MDITSYDNIQKLVQKGFSEEESIHALNLKKSLPLAIHYLVSNKSAPLYLKNTTTKKTTIYQSKSITTIESDSSSDDAYLTKKKTDLTKEKEPINPENFSGTIKRLDYEKAYGFIRYENTDIFFHFSDKKYPNDNFDVGDEVYFVIGENRMPGKNMGRLCAKQISKRYSASYTTNPNIKIKRKGVILETGENFGFVQDSKTQKRLLFHPKDYIETFNLGDVVLFFVEIQKKGGVSSTKATELEHANKMLKRAPQSTTGNIADLTKNYFVRHDIYPADESRSVEFKALTKTANVTQRIMDISQKYMVAFLNADGGKLFCGILDNGNIIGLPMPRKMRDEIRLGVDSMVADIRPPVPNDLYSLRFIPVFGKDKTLNNYFVVCLECKKGSDIYVDSKLNSWIRRDGSVRTMSVPMAQVLWKKRMEEKQSLSHMGGNLAEFKKAIRSLFRSEFQKAAKDQNLSLLAKENKPPPKPLFGPDALIDISCLDSDDIFVSNPSKKTKNDSVIDLIDFQNDCYSDPNDTFKNPSKKMAEKDIFKNPSKKMAEKDTFKNPSKKMAEKDTFKKSSEKMAEKDIFKKSSEKMAEKDIFILDSPNFNTKKIDKRKPRNAVMNEDLVQKLQRKGYPLAKVLETLYLLNKERVDTETREGYKIAKGRLKTLKDPFLALNPLRRKSEKEGDDLLTRVEEVIDETIRNIRSPKLEEKEENGDSDEEEDGFFGYIDANESFYKAKKKVGDSKTNKKENCVDRDVRDALEGEEDFYSEEKLYRINRLVYPLTAKLVEKSRNYRAALRQFLEYIEENSSGDEVSMPKYKTDFIKRGGYSSVLQFKFGRNDYLLRVEDVKSYDLAEEMVTKKALCQLEDKGVLFLAESSVRPKIDERYDMKVCHECRIQIPSKEYAEHSRNCAATMEEQRRAFQAFESKESKTTSESRRERQ